MSTWGCAHFRLSEFTWLANSTDDELRAVMTHGPSPERHMARHELAARSFPCPGCLGQNRRNNRHWSALALAIVIALLVLCAMAGDR